MQKVLTFVLMLLFNFYVKRAPIEFEKKQVSVLFWLWLSDNCMDNSSIHSDKVRLGLTGCFQQTLPKLSNSISRPRSCCLRILAWMLFLSKLRG